jgi:hypothetical protein
MPDTIPPPAGDDPDDDVGVEFEKWAQASAKLLRRSVIERAEVLRESGLASTWKEVDEHWYEALIQDLDSGKLERLDRYMAICREEMDRRAREEEEVKSPLDAIGGSLEPDDEPSHPGAPTSSTPAATPQALASVTPPLGSANESIEVDLTDIDIPDEDEDDEPSADDTRVSAAIPELPSSD